MPTQKSTRRRSCARKPCPKGFVCDPIDKVCLDTSSDRGAMIHHIRQTHKAVPKGRRPKKSKWTSPLRQGDPGFGDACRRYLTKLNITKETLNLKCKEGSRDLFGYQKIFKALVHPSTPVDRCLCRYRTGAGKTRNMITLLDNYFQDPRAKFVLCPNTEVVSNFYSELLTYDSAYKGYVFNKLKEKRWARKTKTFKQFHKKVFAKFNCTRPGCGNVVHDDIMCKKCGKLHKLTLEEVKDILSLKGTILVAGQKGLMAGPLRCYRITGRQSILVRKNHPMINHNRRRFGEPSSPYDNSIVIVDEVHNLFLKTSDQNKNHKRDLLVKALTKASNLVLCGLTATPITNHEHMDQQYNKLMTFIKGTDGKNKSNAEGYIFNFNALLPTLFPRVIPKLGFDADIKQYIIGHMIFVTLSQAHADLYAKKHSEAFGDDVKSVNQLSSSKTKWLMNYANTTSFWTKGGLANCKDNLRKDPYTHMAKFKQIVEDVSKRPQEKTLIILSKQANFLCMIEAFAYLFRQKNIKVAAFNRACEVMDFVTNSDSIKYWTQRTTCKESEEYNNMKDGFNSFNPTKDRGYGFDNQSPKNRVLIIESSSFSEGISFFGVRRIILVNPPLDLKSYEQQIGSVASLPFPPLELTKGPEPSI